LLAGPGLALGSGARQQRGPRGGRRVRCV